VDLGRARGRRVRDARVGRMVQTAPHQTHRRPFCSATSPPAHHRVTFGLGLCAQQGVSLAGESPAAPSQGGMRRQEAGHIPAASRHKMRGGQGVHREMESEGPASNLRAVAEARARRTGRP
jgi:hypothetical protein